MTSNEILEMFGSGSIQKIGRALEDLGFAIYRITQIGVGPKELVLLYKGKRHTVTLGRDLEEFAQAIADIIQQEEDKKKPKKAKKAKTEEGESDGED